MGYETRSNRIGGDIQTFWPDDTASEFWLDNNSIVSLSDILNRAREKWGQDIDLSRLHLSAHHIQTDCLGYDRYDVGTILTLFAFN